jgi:hypothetical protein
MVCKYFLAFCELSFHFLDGVLWSTNDLNFDEVQFILFWLLCFWYITKKPLPNPQSQRLFPTFSPKNFVVWAVISKSLIHNFVIWVNYFVWYKSKLLLLHVRKPLVKKLLFPLVKWSWHPCWKWVDHMWVFPGFSILFH